MQLSKPFKEFPVGTQVKLIQSAKPLALVSINGKQYMIPSGSIATTSNAAIREDEQTKKEIVMASYAPAKIKTAEEATRLITVACYCGAIRHKVSVTARWREEHDALQAAIAECGLCGSDNE